MDIELIEYNNTVDFYIYEAAFYMSHIEEMSAKDKFYMEDGGEKKTKENESFFSKSLSSIKSAIDSIISAIGKFIANITDNIAVFFQSKANKEKIEKLRQALEKNPELKNKKITTVDAYRFKKEMEKLYKEVDDLEKLAMGKNPDFASIEEKRAALAEKIKGASVKALNSSAVPITLDGLLRSTEAFPIIGKGVTKLLRENESVMQALKDSIGDEAAEKYANQIEKNGNKSYAVKRLMQRTGISKLKSLIFGEEAQGLKSIGKLWMKDINDAITGPIGRSKQAEDLQSNVISAVNKQTGSNITNKQVNRARFGAMIGAKIAGSPVAKNKLAEGIRDEFRHIVND